MANTENKEMTNGEEKLHFDVIKPVYFNTLSDKDSEELRNIKYTVTTTPVAVEYSFPLYQRLVVEKLISMEEPLSFYAQPIKDEYVEQYVDKAQDIVDEHPDLAYYGLGRSLVMTCLQDRRFALEKRFILMNFAFSTLDKLVKEKKNDDVHRFTADFLRNPDKSKIMEIYSKIQPNPELSIIDAVYLLNALPATPEFEAIKEDVYKKLGYKNDLSNVKENPVIGFVDKYMSMKKAFFHDYLGQGTDKDKQYKFENVLIGIVWSMGVPCSDVRYGYWHNFVFFNQIFNAIKTTLTVYMCDHNTDKDFVDVITAFDATLRNVSGSLVQGLVEPTIKRGFDTNGDMAIMAIS